MLGSAIILLAVGLLRRQYNETCIKVPGVFGA